MPFNSKEKYNRWKRKQYLKNRKAEIVRKKRYYATRKGREALYASIDKYVRLHPQKHQARLLLRAAVRAKKIIRRPCEVCGMLKSQAHHDDYTRPYDVVWLCSAHHGQRHRKSLPPESLLD